VDTLIDEHRDEHGVEPICETLKEAGIRIAPSSYYARKSRPPSHRAARDCVIDDRLGVLHEDPPKCVGRT